MLSGTRESATKTPTREDAKASRQVPYLVESTYLPRQTDKQWRLTAYTAVRTYTKYPAQRATDRDWLPGGATRSVPGSVQ